MSTTSARRTRLRMAGASGLPQAIAQPIEDDAFLQVLDAPGTADADAIAEDYVYRGPLGELLRRLERHEGDPRS